MTYDVKIKGARIIYKYESAYPLLHSAT